MSEVRLGVLWGGRPSPDCLRVAVSQAITCREFVEQLVEECKWQRNGEWRVVERWHGCGEMPPDTIYDLLYTDL